MDLGEFLFGKFISSISRRRARRRELEDQDVAAKLTDLKQRLTVLARALTGETIELEAAEEEGGVRGHVFYLPTRYRRFDQFEDNLSFYLFRVCYLCIQRKLELNWKEHGHSLIESRVQAAQAAPDVLKHMQKIFPAALTILEKLTAAELAACQKEEANRSDLYLLWGKWMSPTDVENTNVRVSPAPHKRGSKGDDQVQVTSEVEAKPQESVTVLEVERKKIEEYTLNHSFEKVDTLDEFNGSWRDLDGSDELSDHKEALEELNLSQVVRVDDPTHSVYQMDLRFGSNTAEARDADKSGYFLTYDEWNGAKRQYRKDFCRVYPELYHELRPGYAAAILTKNRSTSAQLKRRLGAFRNELEEVKRQAHGEHPDLDAVVDNYANLVGRRTPSERIYTSKRLSNRDVSVLILLDLSLSTDGYTDNHRIWDVERESVILFADVLEEYGDRFQIDGFSSRTRNHCQYVTLKSFDEKWISCRDRLGAIEPQGYTRIGAAVRHATKVMSEEQASKRWILLLSDGKPSDYDRYEGRYGLADVRQAIKEAHGQNIQTYALAVEAKAKNYLPVMLGEGGYRILPRPTHLPEALAAFYQRLMR